MGGLQVSLVFISMRISLVFFLLGASSVLVE